MAYLVLVLQFLQLHLLSTNMYLQKSQKFIGFSQGSTHIGPSLTPVEVLIPINPLWIYRNDKHSSIVKLSTKSSRVMPRYLNLTENS